MSSSFRKRVVKRPIPGTRTSPQTGQIITSSGNPSLDVILGGGLPIGSICLIEEDKFVTYSKVLAKYFLAEGVLSKQSIFLGSLDDSPKELMKKLPQHCTEPAEEENIIEKDNQSGLRIAWRYNDLPMVNSEQTNEKIGHNFNLMEHMDPKMLALAQTTTWSDDPLDNEIVIEQDIEEEDAWDVKDTAHDYENDATYIMDASKDVEMEEAKINSTPNLILPEDEKHDMSDDKSATVSAETSATSSLPTPPSPSYKPNAEEQLFTNTKYLSLLKEVNSLMREEKFHSGSFLVKRSLCRVCLTSLGSPQWYDEHFGEDLLKFLTILRAAVRSAVAVCFITMPMHLVAKYDDTLVSKIRNLVDYAIELETFAGSDKETNPAFKEYNGLFQMHKITAINTLSAYMPETTDLAFKLKRKKFVIEKLHLPPELQDDSSTAKQDTKPTFSCGSNISSNPNISMDF